MDRPRFNFGIFNRDPQPADAHEQAARDAAQAWRDHDFTEAERRAREQRGAAGEPYTRADYEAEKMAAFVGEDRRRERCPWCLALLPHLHGQGCTLHPDREGPHAP